MCNRKYNEKAFDKHLTHCEKKYKESMFKSRGNAPSSQMGARNNNNNKQGSMNNMNMNNNMNNNMNMRPNLNTKFGKK